MLIRKESIVKTVLVEKPTAQVSIVTLNRPERLNAMSAELMGDLVLAVKQVGEDNETRIAILTGAGRAFSSGLDLEDHGLIPGVEGFTIPRMAMRAIEHYSKIVGEIRVIPQPVIAVINGPAYGGGLCLSLGADIRIAETSAVFNATGIVNGLTSTELGASYLLPRLIGASRANEIMLTGRTVKADEAERIGLVSRVVPDEEGMSTAMEMAKGMCRFSPFGLTMTKQTLWANLQTSSFQAAMELENRNQILLGHTNNLPECILARRENREPLYEDDLRKYE